MEQFYRNKKQLTTTTMNASYYWENHQNLSIPIQRLINLKHPQS